MNKVEHRVSVTRRSVLNVGLGVIALIGLAACGAQAATPTVAPSATSAPAAATATAPASATATTAPAATATTQAAAEPTATTAAEATATAETKPATTGRGSVYQIDPAQSKVSFTLNEKLMGNPKTVIGTTPKVSGVITASFDQAASAQIGTIQIDASDLSTDSDMRNRAIQRFILQAAQPEFQYIIFEPTSIEGMPATVKVGDSIPLKITGNLKIRNIAKPVTFDATVTVKSDTELNGSAKTTVTRAMYELNIPNVPSVADVTDEVALELQFVATKQ
jgi:polyisoprenoid-binding protein YceI